MRTLENVYVYHNSEEYVVTGNYEGLINFPVFHTKSHVKLLDKLEALGVDVTWNHSASKKIVKGEE